ncbi:MAG: hypothetical protein AB8C13_04910 [Phycisphaerales bacterium]
MRTPTTMNTLSRTLHACKAKLPHFTKSATTALVLGAFQCVMIAPAIAQSSISLSTVESASISGSQGTQITDYVSQWTQRATESDMSQAERAQTRLLEPLMNTRVSISFRRAYSDALGTYLDELESSDSIASTFMSLRLAGELGTTRGSQVILAGLNHTDPGVRIFAAGRAGRTFRTTASNGPALSANDLSKLINKLDSITDTSSDSALISACIQALGEGCSLPSDDFLIARSQCLSAMSDAASRQLKNGQSDLESRVRLAMLASSSATNSLLQVGEDSTKEGIKSAVGLGAEMIALALSDVINRTMPDVKNRELHVALVGSGESLLYFSLREFAEFSNRPVGNVQQTQFAALLQSGEDRDFRNKAALLLGAGSPIIVDFQFPDDAFVN